MTTTPATIDDMPNVGRPFVASGRVHALPAGWVEHELGVAGSATSFRARNAMSDAKLDLAQDGTAPYRTRIIVRARQPTRRDFNGTVLVEWLNISGGVDADPDYTLLADELHRGGYAWVGVSAQHIGIEGGAVAVPSPRGEGITGRGLKALQPERYGSLHHPGDAFAYDIYTQVARAIRAGMVLAGLTPARIVAVGSSQSAFALTTYINGIHPLACQFDGFLVHSRGGGAAPLGEPGTGIDMLSALAAPTATIRDDTEEPVLILETETDLALLGYVRARQDDTARIRTWEVAGTAHADQYIVASVADWFDCGGPINDGPHHFVAKAALRALNSWVHTRQPPPVAPRLEIDESGALRRDVDGIACGGIRTPQVDVPAATLSGEARQGASIMCMLFGSTTPLSDERLTQLYPSTEQYSGAYEAATDRAIAAGFMLAEDRGAVLADARPERLPAGC